jgi:GT2 family glycosyltransferase
MKGNFSVSVVLVNWNGAKHLRVCLPSLAAQSLKPLEIIVVDNCSADDSAEVARDFAVRWLPLRVNLGLGPALNQGVKIAKGDFVLFVNNDMRFDPGFVGSLGEALRADSQIFAVDGMQLNWDGTSRAHMAARITRIPCRRNSSTELVPGLHFYQQEKTEKSSVFMASAACMMVRKTIFDKLGGFDERLPLGYEDVDICWRGWLRGQKTIYIPSAVCWHRIGASITSVEAARFAFRGVLTGRILFATKLLPTRYALRTWLVSTAGLARDLSRRRWAFAMDRIRILVQMVGVAPQLIRERRTLFRYAGHSPDQQLDILLRLTNDDL